MTDTPPSPETDYIPKVPEPLDFWGTPEMETIRLAALATDTPPMTMLATTLVVLTSEIDPRIRIDSFGDGIPERMGNLNLFVTNVGPSGTGKSLAVDTAHLLVGRNQAGLLAPSSGEAIPSHFKGSRVGRVGYMNVEKGEVEWREEKKYIWLSRAALMQIDESMNFASVAQRSGNTILGMLNTAWSCGHLITNTSSGESNRHVPKGCYRLSGIVSAQPNATDAFLGKTAENGTTQRFIFTKASFDIGKKFDEEEHPIPKPLNLDLPEEFWVKRKVNDLGIDGLMADDILDLGEPEPLVTRYAMKVPANIRKEMRDRTRATKIDGNENPYEGHSPYNQVKVASALALLHGRIDVTQEDWERAAAVMQESYNLRVFYEQVAQAQKFADSVAEGRRAATVRSATEDATIQRWAERVGRTVWRHALTEKCAEGCKPRCIRDTLKERYLKVDRNVMDSATTRATTLGFIVKEVLLGASGTSTGERWAPGPKSPNQN